MKKIKFKIYKNNTGLLIPFSFSKDTPFKPKRIFIIYGKKNSIRGDHAHLKCSQFLVPIFGSMTVYYENKKGKFSKFLSFAKKDYLLIKPNTWCKIKFNTSNSKLMVFCDREYEFKDYIEEYSHFKKRLKNKI